MSANFSIHHVQSVEVIAKHDLDGSYAKTLEITDDRGVKHEVTLFSGQKSNLRVRNTLEIKWT